MKKVAFIMAIAAAAGMASCTAQTSKESSAEIDSLSYAIGMARTNGLEQYLMQQFGIDSTQTATFLRGFKKGAREISEDDVAYVAGMQIGQMVSKNWLEAYNKELFAGDSTQTINRDRMVDGFIAGVAGEHGEMEMAMAEGYVRTHMESVKEKSIEKMYGDNKAAGEKFLAENKVKEGVVTTESGLQYKIITKGTGEIPEANSQVEVNYRGTLIDGTEFDSSYNRKDKDGNPQPATFRANQVIKGWGEALTMMPVGSKWEIYVPSDLAYGSRLNPGSKIEPYSVLIFEVELVSIKKEKK